LILYPKKKKRITMSLPVGWEQRFTDEGVPFYVDHNTRQTHWTLPSDFLPASNSSGVLFNNVPPVQAQPMQPAFVPQPTLSQTALPVTPMQRNPSITGVLTVADYIRTETQICKPGDAKFNLHCSKSLLQINVNGSVFVMKGSMISYIGELKFKSGSGGSLSQKLLKGMTGEGPSFMTATGRGTLYVAQQGKKIFLLQLVGNDSITVNGNDLLALEDTVKWEVKMMANAGALSGGYFNVVVSGQGVIAISTHGDPFTMAVCRGQTVFTDPNAAVAWSTNISAGVHADVNFKTLIGKSSGETVQLKFTGKDQDGFVVVQPYEEHPML